jgi:hypothetical protein
METLTPSICNLVSGGRPPLHIEFAERLSRDTTIGAGAGGVLGIVASNTAAGAARGGAIGAAAGFAFGTGWWIGLMISDKIVDPWIMHR